MALVAVIFLCVFASLREVLFSGGIEESAHAKAQRRKEFSGMVTRRAEPFKQITSVCIPCFIRGSVCLTDREGWQLRRRMGNMRIQ